MERDGIDRTVSENADLARKALELADVIERTTSPADVAETLAVAGSQLGPLRRRILTDVPMTADLSASVLRRRLWSLFAPVCATLYGPALSRHILGRVRGENREFPDVISAAETLRLIHRRTAASDVGLEPVLFQLVEELVRHTIQTTVNPRDLAGTTDAPDLRSLSFDFLRIEGTCWILETLGSREAAGELSWRSRRLCRAALTRCAATIDGFVASCDTLALFDSVAVVSRIDDILTLAARLSDALRDREEEPTAFVPREDESALSALARSLIGLTDVVGRVAIRGVGRASVSPVVVGSALRQLLLVARLVRRFDGPRPLDWEILHQRLSTTAAELAVRTEKVLAVSLAGDRSEPAQTRRHENGVLVLDLFAALGLSPASMSFCH